MHVMSRGMSALLVLGATAAAHATIWIGNPSSAQEEITAPEGYTNTVGSLLTVRYTFDDLSAGTSVQQANLGGLVMVTSPVSVPLVVRSGLVAGTEPSSAPHAVLVGRSEAGRTKLTLHFTEPVLSVGFVLMGLQSDFAIRTFGSGQERIDSYPGIPGSQVGIRRWIGVYEGGRDIFSVEIEPAGSEEYAIDDVETGVHFPEPATATLLLIAGMLGAVRRLRPMGNHNRSPHA